MGFNKSLTPWHQFFCHWLRFCRIVAEGEREGAGAGYWSAFQLFRFVSCLWVCLDCFVCRGSGGGGKARDIGRGLVAIYREGWDKGREVLGVCSCVLLCVCIICVYEVEVVEVG